MSIRINMLSKADSVPAQGVGSAYVEQVRLAKEIDSLDISINKRGNNFDIFHIHSVNLAYRLSMNKKHTNIVYCVVKADYGLRFRRIAVAGNQNSVFRASAAVNFKPLVPFVAAL